MRPVLLIAALLVGCGETYTYGEEFTLSRDDAEWYDDHRTVEQGVVGQVLRVDDRNAFDIAYSTPLATEVRAHEVTSMQKVSFDGGVNTHAAIAEIDSTLIASTFSEEDGFFELDLETGSYSLFVKAPESDTWYCADWDEEDQMCVFEVRRNAATIYIIELDYTLAY